MALIDNEDLPEVRSISTSMNPLRFLHAIRRHKSLVLFGLAIGVGLGLFYYVKTPPVFESNAKILITKKNSDVLAGSDIRTGSREDEVANQISMIRSPLIAQEAAKNPKLADIPLFGNLPKEAWPGMILGNLNAVRGDPKTGGDSTSVVILSYRASDPVDAAATLAVVLAAHKKVMSDSYQNLGDETVELITRATDELREDLQEKDEAFRKFLEKSLFVKGKDGEKPQQVVEKTAVEKATIQAGREAILMRDAKIRYHLEAIENAEDEGRSTTQLLSIARRFSDSSRPGGAENRISETLLNMLSTEEDLATTFGNDYVPLQRLRSRIALYRRSIPAHEGGIPAQKDEKVQLAQHIQDLNEELENNETLLAAYDALQAEQTEQFRKARANELTHDMLKGDLDRTKELWDATVKRLKEITLIKEMVGINTLVLADPTYGRKVAPILTTVVLLALVAGSMIGLGFVYLAEVLDRSFRGPEDVVARLGAPVIAHMPSLEGQRRAHAEPIEGATALSQSLFVYHRPKSRDAEAVRGIRTAIYFGSHANSLRIIQFTSAQAGDGKSTLACNVAVSIAQSGKRIILVEADLRRPSLRGILGRDPEIGFAQVLAGTNRWQDALQTIQEVPGLDVLFSGERPDNPAELLTGPMLAESLAEMKNAYDYVIIDSPPLLPVTDPCSIAARVDGVILVVQMGKNTRPNAERACSLLETIGVRILGVVMNRVSKDGGYGYGYSYGGYGYNYGRSGYKYGSYAYRGEAYGRGDAYYEDEHMNGADKTNGAT
jgi:succinoglycan biosynthesis transport protein ExoP